MISIIIPVRNNAARLDQCLRAVLRECAGREDVEVIVVDNGSVDGSVGVARRYAVRTLEERLLASPFAARNTGLGAAQGEVLVLLDSNCIPHPGWLTFGLEGLADDWSVVSGQLYFEPISPGDSLAKFDALYSSTLPGGAAGYQSLPAGNLFVQRKVFQQHGLFIPELRGLGDIEWTQRVDRGGGRLGIATGAYVRYPAKTGWTFARKMFRLGRGHKEWEVYERGTWLFWRYLPRVLRQFLPPSPRFVRRMHRRGQVMEFPLSWLTVFLLCYLTKLLRGGGMLFGKVHPNLYRHPRPEEL